jgi:predicted MFS family arabinose efflux permease
LHDVGQRCGPAVSGLLADWFGLSAIGWFAAAIYSAAMLATAADGFFGPGIRQALLL